MCTTSDCFVWGIKISRATEVFTDQNNNYYLVSLTVKVNLSTNM